MIEMMWASVMFVAAATLCFLAWACVLLAPRPNRRRYRDQHS